MNDLLILQTPAGPVAPCGLETFVEMIPTEELPFNSNQAEKDGTNRVRMLIAMMIEREVRLTPLQKFELASDLRNELLSAREIDLSHLESGREIIEEAATESMLAMGCPTSYSFYDGYLYLLSPEYFRLFFAIDKPNLKFYAKIALLNPNKVIRAKIGKFSFRSPV